VIVRFGTWVGGDMESSSDVHAKSIRETWRARSRPSSTIITATASSWRRRCRRASAASASPPRSCAASRNTARWCPGARHRAGASRPHAVSRAARADRRAPARHHDGRSSGYQQPAQFRADIALIAQSLLANRGAHAGYFAVRRLLYRASTPSAFIWRRWICARAPRCITRCWRRGSMIRSGASAARWSAMPAGGAPRARYRPDRRLRCAR
jgi:phosphoenolpyruvate carboxylase